MLDIAFPGVPRDAVESLSTKEGAVGFDDVLSGPELICVNFRCRNISVRLQDSKTVAIFSIRPYHAAIDILARIVSHGGSSLRNLSLQNGLSVLSSHALVWSFPCDFFFVVRVFPLAGGARVGGSPEFRTKIDPMKVPFELSLAVGSDTQVSELWIRMPFDSKVQVPKCPMYFTVFDVLSHLKHPLKSDVRPCMNPLGMSWVLPLSTLTWSFRSLFFMGPFPTAFSIRTILWKHCLIKPIRTPESLKGPQ